MWAAACFTSTYLRVIGFGTTTYHHHFSLPLRLGILPSTTTTTLSCSSYKSSPACLPPPLLFWHVSSCVAVCAWLVTWHFSHLLLLLPFMTLSVPLFRMCFSLVLEMPSKTSSAHSIPTKHIPMACFSFSGYFCFCVICTAYMAVLDKDGGWDMVGDGQAGVTW